MIAFLGLLGFCGCVLSSMCLLDFRLYSSVFVHMYVLFAFGLLSILCFACKVIFLFLGLLCVVLFLLLRCFLLVLPAFIVIC